MALKHVSQLYVGGKEDPNSLLGTHWPVVKYTLSNIHDCSSLAAFGLIDDLTLEKLA